MAFYTCEQATKNSRSRRPRLDDCRVREKEAKKDITRMLERILAGMFLVKRGCRLPFISV